MTKTSDRQNECSLLIKMPADLVKQLKIAAIENNTSMRAIVLSALSEAGFRVDDIRDRRRAKPTKFKSVA